MLGKDIYKIWSPKDVKWVQWVRPVPFISLERGNIKENKYFIEYTNISIDKYLKDTAIFVDLEGHLSIQYGISLSRVGYRPIPVFNGTDSQNGVRGILNNELLESSLISGGLKLKNIELKSDANPAFLLDNLRINRYRQNNSIFDNSWDLYGQDIPSCEYFKNNGINKIIIVSDRLQHDLRNIFLKFNNIEFYITDGFSQIKEIKIKKKVIERLKKEEI